MASPSVLPSVKCIAPISNNYPCSIASGIPKVEAVERNAQTNLEKNLQLPELVAVVVEASRTVGASSRPQAEIPVAEQAVA